MSALTPQAKAATLIEALPWLDRFHGATVVIKTGGRAMDDPVLRWDSSKANSRVLSSLTVTL